MCWPWPEGRETTTRRTTTRCVTYHMCHELLRLAATMATLSKSCSAFDGLDPPDLVVNSALCVAAEEREGATPPATRPAPAPHLILVIGQRRRRRRQR